MGVVILLDGRQGKAVIVGPRDAEKGASLVVVNSDTASPEAIPLSRAADLVSADVVVDVLCMQERLHGSSGLEPPADLLA